MNIQKNEKKETDELLFEAKIGKDVKLRKIKYGNKEYYDIRRYYNDFPMKKGIRLNEEDFLKLKELILTNF
jgi:hypothetical protein